MAFKMDDYVDVNERIDVMFSKYPDASLQSDLEAVLNKDGELIAWKCVAYAYRTPDDPRPGVGHAVEPVPGKTPYTRDSEAMNAETSAWGRAIVALGFRTKKIASKQEVQARQAAAGTAGKKPRSGPAVEATPKAAAAPPEVKTENGKGAYADANQRKELFELAKATGVEASRIREILQDVTGQQATSQIPAGLYDAVIHAIELEGVPFE